jgi:hypothetical protein
MGTKINRFGELRLLPMWKLLLQSSCGEEQAQVTITAGDFGEPSVSDHLTAAIGQRSVIVKWCPGELMSGMLRAAAEIRLRHIPRSMPLQLGRRSTPSAVVVQFPSGGAVSSSSAGALNPSKHWR